VTDERTTALQLAQERLDEEWDPELALLYSEIAADDAVSQLAAVESWLKQYGEKPVLLLVAGRLCLRNRLWGRARSYLEASLKGMPRAETWLDLGRLYEEVKDPAAAQAAYRKGLEMATKG
jgi:HemY protein